MISCESRDASSIAWITKIETCSPQGLQALSADVEPARARTSTQDLMASRKKQYEISENRQNDFYQSGEDDLVSH